MLTRAIHGHEEANVRYLSGRGAAINVPLSPDIPDALRTALLDPATASAARAIAAPDAARDIADALTTSLAQQRRLMPQPAVHLLLASAALRHWQRHPALAPFPTCDQVSKRTRSARSSGAG
ncbi:MAG: hypothetical protein WEF86_12170 [Gemmatimonadota bacterium]